MANELQNLQKRKTRNSVDIVFCIDASASMKSCMDGVKQNIRQFVDGLQATPNRTIDFRLGILAHDWKVFRIYGFTDQVECFQQALEKVRPKWEEFTFPAIDWSLDFEWRHGCHKAIIAFTDEVLKNSHDPEFQMSKFNELRQKILDLSVTLWLIAPQCPEYADLCKTPRAEYHAITKDGFVGVDFKDLMNRIGRSLSASAGQTAVDSVLQKDLYGLGNQILIETLT